MGSENYAYPLSSNTIISISEVNQSFPKAMKMAEQNGQAVIIKNNRPKFLLIDLESNPTLEMADDEEIDFVARRILTQYRNAFLELAK